MALRRMCAHMHVRVHTCARMCTYMEYARLRRNIVWGAPLAQLACTCACACTCTCVCTCVARMLRPAAPSRSSNRLLLLSLTISHTSCSCQRPVPCTLLLRGWDGGCCFVEEGAGYRPCSLACCEQLASTMTFCMVCCERLASALLAYLRASATRAHPSRSISTSYSCAWGEGVG